MSNTPKTYHRVYRDFKAIAPTAYQQIIRFYEEQESAIIQLSDQRQFELLVVYTDALFEVGAYGKHLVVVDRVIEYVIRENVFRYQRRDLYRDMLFRKAAARFQIGEYERASYILHELIKMYPKDEAYPFLLKKVKYKMDWHKTGRIRAFSIGLVLLTALICAVELLFIRPFYANWVTAVEFGRTSLFLIAILLLSGGELLLRWRIYREVKGYQHRMLARKNQSSKESR